MDNQSSARVFGAYDLVEIGSWVSAERKADAERRIAVDRRAVAVIDDLLNQEEKPPHTRHSWFVELSFRIGSTCYLAADNNVLKTINNALPTQDGVTFLLLAKARLQARIATFEKELAA